MREPAEPHSLEPRPVEARPVEPRPRGTDALGRPLPTTRQVLRDPTRASAIAADAGEAADAPAGFWRRAAAWCLDWLILSPLLVLLLRGPLASAHAAFSNLLAALQDWMLEHALLAPQSSAFGLARQVLQDPALHRQLGEASATMQYALLIASLRACALAALWFVGFEASAWAATPGKRLLGLRVTNMQGARVSPAQALGRFAAGALSWLTLNLGHALAGWRRDHRALHDLIAGTQVRGHGPTPRWARALVFAIVVLVLFSPLLLFGQLLAGIVP
jgi:uncharacterized RDD family membrane protein YckC